MSVAVMTWVWRCSRAQGVDRFVLLAIADSANDEGTDAWPSLARLVQKTGLSERTVRRAIRACEELGELRTEQEKRKGRVVGNRYEFPAYATGQSDRWTSSPPAKLTGGTSGQSDRSGGVTVTGVKEPSSEPSTGGVPAPAREEPFGHDPEAAAMAPVYGRWREACTKAKISEYIASSTFGSVLAGFTDAIKGGEPREDVLEAFDELALSLARKPRAVPSRLDIALRVMRARKAEQSATSATEQYRAAQQRQEEREAQQRERWDRAERIAFSLQNGDRVAVPPELTDEVRSCLAGWVGWDRVDAVIGSAAAA